ncbi:MAG: M56 family metallopeptidase [Paludisphaera borealis]|uniref:M56 family metallopeptidase n=1 Tax=Paludisphaera borealis TaxID=1387353 RepID=UPI0028513F87|nr:M56 family metallopeptidase [Paludisphaera borealis]MDR3621249.1 M56 family metallopeptidase [Paludisphaera borealis]
MNVSTWATSPAWTAAGWTMLHFLWVGAALTALAAIGRRALRKAHPDVRHAFALATLAALALAPAAIAWTIADGPRSAVAVPKESKAMTTPPIAFASALPAPKRGESIVVSPRDASPDSHGIIYLTLAARTLPGVWLLGAPWTFAYLAAGLLGAERLKRRSRMVGDPDLSALSARLAGSLGIGRRVAVGVCDRIAGPMLLGIARPLILLPASAASGWSPEQVEMALLHELAHVRRWDNLVNLLQRVVESALFFHPAVWIVSGWVRREREHCCDRIVVDHTGRALDYADALFVLADAPSPGAPFAHGAFMAQNHLVDRIRRILNPEEPAMRLSRSAVALAASTLAVPAILLAAYAQQPSPQQPETRAKAKPFVPDFRRSKGSEGMEYRKKVAIKPNVGAWEPGPIPESISANLSGVARDEQGEPVAGASLTLYTIAGDGKGMKSVASAASDASGRYEFRDARLTVRSSLFNGHPFPKEQTPYAPFFILGQAPGMGIAWSKQPSIYAVKNPHPNDVQGRLPLGEPATLDLTFARAAALQGKVIDDRGEPVAGAEVHVDNAISLDAEGRETGIFQGYDWRITPDGVGRTTTGADGGFRLEGLSERFCYYVSVKRPESPNTMLSLRAATIDGPDATHDEPPMGPDYAPRSHQARTNPITITFPKPRPIDVSVVGDDDGKPVAGAEVLLAAARWSTGFSSDGVTDAAGKVRLGLPPGQYAVVGSGPPKDSRFLRTKQDPLIVEAGDAPMSLEIRQKVGAELIIEAVEAGTGKPMPDVFFWRTVDDQPDQKIEPGDDLVGVLEWTSTNEKGELRGLFTPRPGRRHRFFFGGMRTPNNGWFSPAAPEKHGYEAVPTQSEPVELIPGKSIRLRFELSKAKPAAAENLQTPRSLPRAFTRASPAKPDAEPRAEGPMARTMLAQVSGVARDDRGEPIAKASVTLYAVDFDSRPAAATTTGDDGRYEFRDVRLPVMTTYSDHRMPPGPPHAWCLVSGRAPGMGIAWGREWLQCTFDPALRRYRAVSPAKLDLTFARSAVVRGKVVDDHGVPVPGAMVRVVNYAALVDGGEKGDFLGFEWNVLPDGLGRSQTGADGGFRIEGLSERFCYSLAVTRPKSPRTEFGLFAATVDGPDQDHGSIGFIQSGSFISSGHQARTNPITITLPKLRPIDVSVIGGDDGKPVAGARVKMSGGSSTLQYTASGDTDAAGKLRLNLPPGEHAHLTSNPPGDSRYLRTSQAYVIPKSDEPAMPLEIRQKVGAELILEAVEAGTGKPMPGVSFMWDPEDGAIRQPTSIDDVRVVGFRQTSEEGELHVAVEPAPGRRYRFRFDGLNGPDLTSLTLEDATSPSSLAETVRKKGYEAAPAQSEPVELVPGKPIRLRFELRKGKAS